MAILLDTFGVVGSGGYTVPKRVNGLSSATYILVGAGQGGPNIQPKKVNIKTVEANGVVGDCLISVGTNSPDYDNILKVYRIRPVPEAVETIDMSYTTREFQDVTDPFANPEIRLNVSTTPSAGTLNFKISFDFEPNEVF